MEDPRRLLEEWIAPALKRAVAGDPAFHDIEAIIELELRGAGTWYFVLERGGALELEEGRADHPAIILELDGSDLPELVLGALRPAAALVDGRLELAGDVALAMRLAPLLKAIEREQL